MNTKKHLPLNGTQVERATQIFRAYKHPYRYEIINLLLGHGELTEAELTSYLNKDESYVAEQLGILTATGLVLTGYSEKGSVFYANEEILIRMRDSVRNLA
ncbi:MAG: helix-turn-helix transcriptional regulator [Saprospiraceae bacterium]|jgi:DNA-binding transcriptional ArsR family regulator